LGASAVLVIAAVVGNDLETLLDAGTVMGTEVMVEVHTPNELEYALSKGATIFLINMWDRFTGKLFSNQVSLWKIFSEWGIHFTFSLQAKIMASLLPVNACAAVTGNIATIDQVLTMHRADSFSSINACLIWIFHNYLCSFRMSLIDCRAGLSWL
jgi:hypothetical protein